MSFTLIRSCFVAFLLIFAVSVSAEPLAGTTGDAAGDRWQSSWLDLKPPTSFKKGERLLIKVEGDAENVLVRLLPNASSPSSSDGIEGRTRKGPAGGGVLDVKLERDHPNVKQISVHAGREAWGTPLGGNNGNVKVVSIERRSQ
jgi:hypothetical protein